MKVGQIVKHKDVLFETLRVKKIYESVAVVERLNQDLEYNVKGELRYPVYVCLVESLENN